MKKRKVLLAALLICFTLSLQEANATSHIQNKDLTNDEYTGYSDRMGGVLQVDKDNTNTVNGSTLKGNTASSSGGAVYNSGTVNVQGAKFEENKASYTNGQGGAIYNEGTLTVKDSSFSNNRASERTELWYEEGHGGAIYNKNKATITNSTFTGNHARYGGAIYNEGKDADLTVQGTFKDNTAQTGGAINNSKGTVTVGQGSVFENNTTTRYDGGAIVNDDGTINIGDDVTFKNNKVFNPEEDTSIQRGGAIFSEGNGNSKIEIGKNVTFEGNKAISGGGIGLYQHNDVTIGDNATFKNNQAGREGGAIDVYTIVTDPKASSFTIGDNAIFEGNQAGFTDEEGYTPDVVFGGAIAISEQMYDEEKNSSFTIGNNAVFRNNKAKYDGVYGYGGALYNAAYNTTVGNGALFDGNISDYGGAVYNQANLEIGQNAVFTGNTATAGGAIINYSSLTLGNNAVFRGNSSSNTGGAIYNAGTLTLGDNAVFDGNNASMGGAIYNTWLNETTIQKAIFQNNEASLGGAIYNDVYYGYDGTNSDSKLNITDSGFYNNKANKTDISNGGAIYTRSTLDVKNSSFKNNMAQDNGGAIYSEKSDEGTLHIEGSVLENNTADVEGGAIWTDNDTTIANSLFKGNTVTGTKFTPEQPNYSVDKEGGGAIFIEKNSKTDITSSDFINNSSGTVGGAIATRSNTSGDSSLTISGSNFSGNSAKYNGGAIASYIDMTITDTSFTNNKAGEKGGAIWANGNVTINATDKDIVFAGNSAQNGGDIYMDNLSSSKKIGTLTLTSAKDKNITLADGISGAEAYNVNLNGEGTVTFNGEIKNAVMSVTNNGTLHLAQGSSLGEGTIVNVTGATLDSQDGKINDYSGKVNLGDNSKLKFDLSSANKTTDKFSMAEGFQSGTVKVEDFNFMADTKVSRGNMTADEIKESLGLGEEITLELPEKSFRTLTPLRYVNVQSGENGISYSPTGNSYRDFNPAVMAAPIAAQIGGYLTQLDSYDEAFRNMDMYMLMPKSMRQSMKYQNKYASADNNENISYDNSATPYDNTAIWARPYATFENVGLKRGPRVSNVAWGSYFGGDSQLFELGNGWEGMFGVYAGYNGSHQAYNGISIYQNGGTLGLTGTLYKNDFFTGLTANVGANAAEASTNYGDDSFALLRTGIASKTGYNFEFADGKFIIQPSWLMSYSFVNTGDYTTSSGIKVNSDPLNAIHIEPGLKFIGNGNKGWQPYAGLSIVWNFLDKTDFKASDATLPELSIKPFFKYGVGLRKLYGERFVGYGQIYFTNGGRNGVGFQFGGRWTL